MFLNVFVVLETCFLLDKVNFRDFTQKCDPFIDFFQVINITPN